MNTYSPKEYWSAIAENFCAVDALGLAPVLHPGAPPWFNLWIDRLQFHAVKHALALAELKPGASILDVGCGTGRWLRRYRDMGLHATGADATAGMLRLAREQRTSTPLVASEACRLPFAREQFDAVSDITVVQHIPQSLQREALSEMSRVLRPGGRLILMELIQGRGGHIFSRSPQDWIQLAGSCGLKVIDWFGQEFLLLDRVFVRAAQVAGRRESSRSIPSTQHSPIPVDFARRVYWNFRRITVTLSAWADPIAAKMCPTRLATHGVFIFRK